MFKSNKVPFSSLNITNIFRKIIQLKGMKQARFTIDPQYQDKDGIEAIFVLSVKV